VNYQKTDANSHVYSSGRLAFRFTTTCQNTSVEAITSNGSADAHRVVARGFAANRSTASSTFSVDGVGSTATATRHLPPNDDRR
jgi:hypothetical protein